ncbi:type II secretion system protein [bacterium]|nr:type II secretion system protein [bacterium]
MKKTNKTSFKKGFTLAEILITLGIIGVVAVLTLPLLMANYRKHVVENKLKKFYTIMNQAVKFSEAEYGEFSYWDGFESGNPDAMIAWWNKYFAPHVKTLKIERINNVNYVYLADGTKLQIFNYGYGGIGFAIHIYFYPKASSHTNVMGKDYFTFYINPNTNKNLAVVEPYKFAWDGTEDALRYSGEYACKASSAWPHYCTALIQFNGWKIPKDYPFRF